MLFMLVSNSATAAIIGSIHDFSTRSWNIGKEICVVCHTPHNSNTGVTGAPLWNHAVTATEFTPYSSPTLDATFGDTAKQPTGASKLCLSCHDGSLGIDEYGPNIGKTNPDKMNPADPRTVGVGGDLTNDHPVSIIYDAALIEKDKTLHALDNPVTVGSGSRVKTGTITSLMVPDGQVQCSSCHDVHNTFITPSGKLLKIELVNSKLCLTCHNK